MKKPKERENSEKSNQNHFIDWRMNFFFFSFFFSIGVFLFPIISLTIFVYWTDSFFFSFTLSFRITFQRLKSKTVDWYMQLYVSYKRMSVYVYISVRLCTRMFDSEWVCGYVYACVSALFWKFSVLYKVFTHCTYSTEKEHSILTECYQKQE